MNLPFVSARVQQPVTMVFDAADGQVVHPQDEQICSMVGQELCRQYPGYAWRVDADHRKGFIDVLNLSLSGDHGFRIEMSGMFTASDLQDMAMRAGGEILERFNVRRGTADAAELAALPEDEFGRPIIPV